jgi:hypothetical protein
VPTGVAVPAEIVSAELDVAGFGENEKVAPLGRPVALRFTCALKPPLGVIVMPYEVLEPWLTVRLDGEALSEKSPPFDCTTSVTVVERDVDPLSPKIVTV